MTRAYLTCGLAFGDEGKGTVVDHLVRTTGAKTVVRYNGGPQCGHNVVTPEGVHHCFAQFGSGTFSGAKTYYSRFALLEPYALLNEAAPLAEKLGRDPLRDFFVEESTIVITPFHWLANRIRETARRADRHGSCGFGVGEARADQLDNRTVLRARDLRRATNGWEHIYSKLLAIRALKIEQLKDIPGSEEILMRESMFSLGYFYEHFYSRVNIVPDGSLRNVAAEDAIVFEGAQGMLLDERYGTAPHNTWTDITFANAERLLAGMSADVTKIGILRSYFTRHGAGPFPTEDPKLSFEDHNREGEWQGRFRFGAFDVDLARYALKSIGAIDGIALTHLDQTNADILLPQFQNRVHYHPWVEDQLQTRLLMTSFGPTSIEKWMPVEVSV